MNYIVYITLILAIVYRIMKYDSFFSKNIIKIKISKKVIKINIEVFLFLLSALLVFGNIKIFDTIIIVLFINNSFDIF